MRKFDGLSVESLENTCNVGRDQYVVIVAVIIILTQEKVN